MAILVTGGAGYIGSHTIVELLTKTDKTVVSADNYINSSEKTYERIQQITGKKVPYYAVDLADEAACESIFQKEKIEGIIHFAALKMVPESVEKPIWYFQNNIRSLLNIIACQKKYGVKQLIFSSSCSVYGNAKALPVTEETELQPTESPYGTTKKLGEDILKDVFNKQDALATISLRYFNPVGAHPSGLLGEAPFGKPNNLVPFITQTAIGQREQLTIFGKDYDTIDGTCVRDYIHVSDIATAHILALQYLEANKNDGPYEVFNLGSGSGVSVLQVVKAFERSTGEKLNYQLGDRRSGDVAAIYANNEKALHKLGWKPEYSLDDMMLSAWKWQQHWSKENA